MAADSINEHAMVTPEAEITAVATGGDGVCRVEGRVCFIPYGLPGDHARIAFGEMKHGVLRARITELLSPSPHRRDPGCPVFGRCGGCTWLHFAYPAQGEWKTRIVRDCFERIGKLAVDVEWREEPSLRLGYRTRATFHGRGGRWGFHQAGSHAVVDIVACPLCHARLNEALGTLRGLRTEDAVEVTVNPQGPETLVWTDRERPELRRTFPAYNSKERDKDGPRASFMFDGAPVVNGAFSQSSLLLNRLLVKTAHELIGEAGSVLDLYCGSGNLTLGLARRARIVGMDHNRAAIRAAQGIGRGDYRVGDEAAFRKLLAQSGWDAVALDPPRAGAKAIADALGRCAAGAIVYVSCDPATLARDAGLLARHGWRVARAVALDLFPNTAHIETVCRFER